jgi:methionyl aminopeptidase
MIQVKNAAQIAMMRDAGKITGEALQMAGEMVRPGVTTKEIDTAIRSYITKCGATPSFLNYNGFPASACISINDEVIHGIPSAKKILKDGDIVKIDVGAYYKGYHGDTANTFPVGEVSEEAAKLIRVTKESFYRGIETIGPGSRLGDLGAAIDGCQRARICCCTQVCRTRYRTRSARSSGCSQLRNRRTRTADLHRYGNRCRTHDQCGYT